MAANIKWCSRGQGREGERREEKKTKQKKQKKKTKQNWSSALQTLIGT